MATPPGGGAAGPGAHVARLEDPELLRGQGRYLDDLPVDALHAVFVRSHDAHARLLAVDLDVCRRSAGVVGAFAAGDLGLRPVPGHAMLAPAYARPPLADGRVRFAGEPIAVVVATTRAAALDAAELVEVRSEPLEPVLDPCAALADGSPVLFDDAGNRAFDAAFGSTADPCPPGTTVVELQTVNQRVAPAPMEPDGALAVPGGPDDGYAVTVWSSTQRVHQVRDAVAGSLDLPTDAVRVRAPLVGGGFGGKFEASPETVVVAAVALALGRPVRWVQTRTENLTGMPHGRGQVQHARLAVDTDGRFAGLDVDVVADAGAYPMVGAVIPNATGLMAPGPYRIPAVRARGRAAVTSTSPVGAYRGAGRPEASALLERLVDRVAARVGVDPVELRHRNLLDRRDFPHTSPTGLVYDSGDPRRCLDHVCRALGYDELRAEQSRRRAARDPVALGIGVAMWLDCTPMNRPSEWASLELRADPDAPGGVRLVVRDGANDQGQAHRTTWGLLAGGVLGLPLGAVELRTGDTGRVPHGEGTGSARSLMLAGAAVDAAATEVLTAGRVVAAHLLEAAPEDVVASGDGRLAVVGTPSASVTWAEVVAAAARPDRPDEVRAVAPDGLLAASAEPSQPGPTFPGGCHGAVVEVDTETGAVRLVRFVAADDCGRVVNPVVVAGQQQGGIVQGIGQALFEEVRHDAGGTPLTATFADYGVPSAAELPAIEVATVDVVSPVNPLGAKGIGQAGAIGSTPAVHNAVVDALAHLGVDHVDLPLTPERVWRAVSATGTNMQ